VRAVLLPLGDECRAIEVGRVREVVAAPLPTPLPAVPVEVTGVFNLRGEMVPLFDLAVLLGLPPTRSAAYAVVVDTPAGPAGLAASALPEAVQLEVPVQTPDGDQPDRHVDGDQPDWRVGNRLVRLLDLDALLAAARARSTAAREA
jgi:purine-binding chemotaxis protein CheW